MFYFAKNSDGHYLCGIDENENPIFSENRDFALYSYSQSRLQGYVDDNDISEATVSDSSSDQGGNNPPQKPPF